MNKHEAVSEWSRINVDAIAVPNRLRTLRDDTVAELTASFAEIGLLNPITVRPQEGGGYELAAGRHRLEAAKRCGWKSIHCIVKRDLDADKAELIELDENLARAELSPAERAMHVERRKKLFEKIHPETKHGGDRKSAKAKSSRQVGDLNTRFTKDTAAKAGQSERSVQRDASRGENVKVLPDIVGTSLDEGAELDALGKLSEAEQHELAWRAKAGGKVSAKPPKEKPANPSEHPSPTTANNVELAAKTPYSGGEHDRLRDRIDELTEEKRQLEIKIVGLESEVEELKARNAELEARIAEFDAKQVEAPSAASTPAPISDLDIPEYLRRSSS